MVLLNFLRRIRKSFLGYRPVVEVLISKSRLLNNLNEYKKNYPKLQFAPVLKSNAYGHGLIEVAQILEKEEKAFFVLDSLYEALILRSHSIKSNILVIGYTTAENIVNSKLKNVSFTITSLDQLKEVSNKLHSKIKIHLKVDTGMHRQGIMMNELESVIKVIKRNNQIILEGVCSHFADADDEKDELTKQQILEWEKVINIFKQNFNDIKYFHISATSGLPFQKQIFANVARLGIGLYGINNTKLDNLNLEPVLEMQSVVSSIRNLKMGESVGYNATFKALKNMKIATVPVGYFEGVDRRLSNYGFFKIEDNFCSIIGRVSMNITSIDVTNVSNIKLGDKVIIISNKTKDKSSAVSSAELTYTIPYEILVHIPPHLRRVVVD